jgi:sortase (surface protein transpeptidase)
MAAGGRVAPLVAGVLVLAASLGLGGARAPAGDHAPRGADSPTLPLLESFRSVRSFEPVAVPVRLRIPAANVDTPLQPLQRIADGTIAVPHDPNVAGWFAEGPRPGQQGPAVIVGHVDSNGGPAVFFHLSQLRPGAEVRIDTADGHSVLFRVTAQARVAKKLFPTELVYSPTLEPSLRLVTCGGTFDRAAGSYRDNVIVNAAPM